MKVLVAYASRHGSTEGIAARVAEVLARAGLTAELRDVEDVDDAETYDAFVVGGAAYMFHWLRPATVFVKQNHRLLSRRPSWLFSSGPLGTDLVDEEGHDVLETSRPKEFTELEDMISPRGTMVFFGAWDPDEAPVGVGERLMRMLPAAREALPTGDFRDWDAIEDWAGEIAVYLKGLAATTAVCG